VEQEKEDEEEEEEEDDDEDRVAGNAEAATPWRAASTMGGGRKRSCAGRFAFTDDHDRGGPLARGVGREEDGAQPPWSVPTSHTAKHSCWCC
jgi:hypothetical protein